MSSKVFKSADDALAGVLSDGLTVMCGGFGLCGNPENLIAAIAKSSVRDLVVISNNCGAEGFGLWHLLNNRQIRKVFCSYIGDNKLFERLFLSGEIELEMCPQGTLAERIRAGGAGIPAFYTRTGVGTVVAEGKQLQEFDGECYLLERWLRADLSIVKAWKGDTAGNLIYRKTAQNFNSVMATAGRVTIAEVEHLVQPGELESDYIHTPGIYVDRIFQSSNYVKRVEFRTTREREPAVEA